MQKYFWRSSVSFPVPSDGRCTLLLIYNNIIKGFPPEAPTHWKPLRIGRFYAVEALRTGRPYAPEGPTHWKSYALEAPTHWKVLPFKKYFIYIYNAPAKLKGDRENSYVAKQNISSAKATV